MYRVHKVSFNIKVSQSKVIFLYNNLIFFNLIIIYPR